MGNDEKLVKEKRGTGLFYIVRELQLEETEGLKELMRMDFKHFNEILNLITATRSHSWK